MCLGGDLDETCLGPYIWSLMIHNEVEKKRIVQIFLFVECLRRLKSPALCQFVRVLWRRLISSFSTLNEMSGLVYAPAGAG